MCSHASTTSHSAGLPYISATVWLLEFPPLCKRWKNELSLFLNHSFPYWVPAPSNKAPFKEFERKILSEIRDSTHFSFYFSQGHYKSWNDPSPAMLDSCQLGQEQPVCYAQITCLPPASPKAPVLPWCHTLQEHQLLLMGPQKQSAVQLAFSAFWGAMWQHRDCSVRRRAWHCQGDLEGGWGQVQTTWHIGCWVTEQMQSPFGPEYIKNHVFFYSPCP